MMAILCTRPAAQSRVEGLSPAVTIHLSPLPPTNIDELTRRLTPSPRVAARAAQLANGNPLFVEQFIAWATESGYSGDGPSPDSLHDVVMARIRHLESVRLRALRERISWTARWMRGDVYGELAAIESEIGLWLDRLETGDYGDQLRLAGYLELLQRIDFELFMAANLSGRPRPRSTRLREAIERLLLGSVDAVLTDMRHRVGGLNRREDPHLADRAERIGRCATENHRWALARHCFELARRAAPGWREDRLREQIAAISRVMGDAGDPCAPCDEGHIVDELERRPAVDELRLPETWYRLGRRFNSPVYYERALQAGDDLGAIGWVGRIRGALAALPR
jgi:hypothetical protein